MDDSGEAELLGGLPRLSADPQEQHLAQQVADQGHIQLGLYSRFRLGEEVPHVQRMLEVAKEDLDSPTKTVDLGNVLWSQALVDQVGHVRPPGAVLLVDVHQPQDDEVFAPVHPWEPYQLVFDVAALPYGVEPAQVLIVQPCLQWRDEVAPGQVDLPPQIEAAVAPV